MKTTKTIFAVSLLLLFTAEVYLVQCSNENTNSGKNEQTAPKKAEEQNQPTEHGTVEKENKKQIKSVVKEKEGEQKKDNVKQNSSEIKVTFIELGSVKCIPCKKMQPIMDEIEKEFAGQVNVVFHDVWTGEGKPYAQKYGIRAIPTQIFLDVNGKEYYRHSGFFPKEELVKILQMKGVN